MVENSVIRLRRSGEMMEGCGGSDFMQWLGADVCIEVLMCLDNPADLVRASAVSSSWRRFVVGNGLCKQLCLKIFPEISRIVRVREISNVVESHQVTCENLTEWSCLERDHKVFAFLARAFNSFIRRDCLADAIVASSTDNYPDESILNTLDPRDRIDEMASYWSSKGEIDPAVPERLIYKLVADLCVITEIHVHPFQAYFQYGSPIYSSKAVRFWLGHPKHPLDLEVSVNDESEAAQWFADDKIVWTYTSPDFPMAQENRLQVFKLPEPALCIGGVLQVELLGRVQRQEIDDRYYICVNHIQVVGRPLSPSFDVEIMDPSGNCTFKYYPDVEYCLSPKKPSEGESSTSPSRFHSFTASIRGWEQIIRNTVFGGGGVVYLESDPDDDDSDDEYIG